MTDRSGSEQRQRTVQIGVRLTPEEAATLTQRAGDVSLAEHLRTTALRAAPQPEVDADEAEARRLLGVAEGESWYSQDGDLPRVAVLIAAAQVYATLAAQKGADQ